MLTETQRRLMAADITALIEATKVIFHQHDVRMFAYLQVRDWRSALLEQKLRSQCRHKIHQLHAMRRRIMQLEVEVMAPGLAGKVGPNKRITPLKKPPVRKGRVKLKS